MAIIDIQAYLNTCSLMAGLVEITKAFDNRKPSRNEIENRMTFLKEQLGSFDKVYANEDDA